MQKSSKILIIVIICTVALCCVAAGIASVVNNSEESAETTAYNTNSTAKSDSDEDHNVTEQTVSATSENTATQTTSDSTAHKPLEELIIGKWMDSAGMSGFEFYEGGRASFTYVNLESFNIPFDGTAKNAMYSLEDNKLTLKYSIYTATIEKKYEVRVENDTLYMKDLEKNETGTYRRVKSESQENSETKTTNTATTSAPQSVADELVGSWINSSGKVKYCFEDNGSVTVVLSNAVVPEIGMNSISGTYKGVYLTEGNKVTIQYSVNSIKVTEKYSFAVSKNSLSLTSESGDTVVYSLEGTSLAPVKEEDLLGVWRDGANMSGYEFKENGVVKMTFVDITIPVIDYPVNGTFTGSYEVVGNEVTLIYSIYNNTISETFIFDIDGNVLSMTNKDSKNVSTYLKK